MSEEGIFIKIIACWMSITLLLLLILFGRNALRARTACTLINKGEQSVIIEDKARKDIYDIGAFKSLVVQLVSIPKASHYQACLVGMNGKCHFQLLHSDYLWPIAACHDRLKPTHCLPVAIVKNGHLHSLANGYIGSL